MQRIELCSAQILAGAGRSAHQKHAVRTFGDGHDLFQHLLMQTGLCQWNGFSAIEQSQHHIFQTIIGRDGSNPQLNLRRAEFGKINLAVLRPALFGYIQVRHDFDARHHGVTIIVWQAEVTQHHTVLAEADDAFLSTWIGLDMDVGNALMVCVKDDFVDQARQGVVRLAEFGFFFRQFFCFECLGQF